MSEVTLKVTNRKRGTTEVYEGTVTISGVRPTKLVRKSDGGTEFNSKSALTATANNFAKSIGASISQGTATKKQPTTLQSKTRSSSTSKAAKARVTSTR